MRKYALQFNSGNEIHRMFGAVGVPLETLIQDLPAGTHWIEIDPDGDYSEPVTISDKLAELAGIRWEQQTGGHAIDGIRFQTDQASRDALREIARREASRFPVKYKAADGFVDIASPEQAAAWVAVLDDFVQACFDREAEVAGQIVAIGEDAEALDVRELWKQGSAS